MSLEDHKVLARRAIHMWASDNADRLDEIVAANYVNHQESDVTGDVSARSLAAWQELIDGYHRGFSNSRVQIEMQIAEGDLVATRFQFTAVHSGDYLDLAPTGKELTWTGIQIDRVENGRIVETWVDWDKYRLFQGLGLVP